MKMSNIIIISDYHIINVIFAEKDYVPKFANYHYHYHQVEKVKNWIIVLSLSLSVSNENSR